VSPGLNSALRKHTAYVQWICARSPSVPVNTSHCRRSHTPASECPHRPTFRRLRYFCQTPRRQAQLQRLSASTRPLRPSSMLGDRKICPRSLEEYLEAKRISFWLQSVGSLCVGRSTRRPSARQVRHRLLRSTKGRSSSPHRFEEYHSTIQYLFTVL